MPDHEHRAAARHAVSVELVELPAATIHALAAGELDAANAASPVPLTPYFVAPGDGVWRLRSRQIEEDPACAPWVTRAIWDPEARLTVGRAGYHGPPDEAGMVEIGYAVDPAFRRRGYARAALEALLARAAGEPGVRTVRVSISPDNAPSLALVAQYGFLEVGEQWDEEDGLETIYEIPADGT